MQKIKTISKVCRVFMTLAVLFSMAILSVDVIAAPFSTGIEFGSVVPRSDGTVTLDYKTSPVGSSSYGDWQQIKLTPNATNGDIYTSTDDGSGMVFRAVDISGSANKPSFQISPSWSDPNNRSLIYTSDSLGRIIVLYGQNTVDGMVRESTNVESTTEAEYTTTQAVVAASQECGVNGGTSFFECKGAGNPIEQVFLSIVKNLFLGVGIMCLIGVVMGGIVYASAGGDSGKTKQGITYVVNSIIGLIVFIGAYTLLNFMVPNGYFDQAGIDTSSPADPSGANLPQVDNWQVGGGPN